MERQLEEEKRKKKQGAEWEDTKTALKLLLFVSLSVGIIITARIEYESVFDLFNPDNHDWNNKEDVRSTNIAVDVISQTLYVAGILYIITCYGSVIFKICRESGWRELLAKIGLSVKQETGDLDPDCYHMMLLKYQGVAVQSWTSFFKQIDEEMKRKNTWMEK